MNFWDSWQSPMALFRLHGKTTRTKEHGEVRDVFVSIPEDFPLPGVYVLLLAMALFIKESTVMLLLSIYADTITSCKESIRILLPFVKPYQSNLFHVSKEG